jgi:hypothetical protein
MSEESCKIKKDLSITPAIKLKKESNSVKFWSQDPNALFESEYILEFFPVDSMTFNQKLNAVSRTVIVMTIIAFVYTRSLRILAIAALSLFCVFMMYYYESSQYSRLEKRVRFQEGFEDAGATYLERQGISVQPEKIFDKPTSGNPLSNVLMPDYDYNVNKKPAPPAYTENGSNEILAKAKQMVVDANPGQPNIANKLFTDLGDQIDFEQSMRPFHSTASTTIPNDQHAFAEFCYGSMISCKEGNMFSCARNLPRYTNV